LTEQIRSTRTGIPWLRNWHDRPYAGIRLFCFPYAGGGASIFHSWSGHLPRSIEVCPVQLPGREDRLGERAFSNMAALLDALVPVLLPYLDMPYAFFGHSMGALISFEVTRYLYRIGQRNKPLHLFVSGHRAPQLPDTDPPTYELPEPEFIEKLRHLKGTPEAVLQNTELLHLLLPLLRADFALCETYSYTHEKPLECGLSAFGGLQDSDVSREALEAWRKQTSGQFKMRFFEGGHFFLHQENARFSLLKALSFDLLSYL
jgi:medium-chain acyl-[acyl-carrier-protein] hydrolase